MKKLKLEVEALTVDSFSTSAAARAGAGTVQAHEWQRTLLAFCDKTLLASNPTCCPCTPRADQL